MVTYALFCLTGLGGSLIAVFSLAVLYEFMSSYHRYLGLPNGRGNTTKEFKGNKRLVKCKVIRKYIDICHDSVSFCEKHGHGSKLEPFSSALSQHQS